MGTTVSTKLVEAGERRDREGASSRAKLKRSHGSYLVPIFSREHFFVTLIIGYQHLELVPTPKTRQLNYHRSLYL